MTIAELKTAIQDNQLGENLGPYVQHLFKKEPVAALPFIPATVAAKHLRIGLEDEKTCAHYDIQDGAILEHLLMRQTQ